MKSIFITAAFLIGTFVSAQEQVLFSINDDAVTANQFKAVYLKNKNIGNDIDPKTPAEYLDLYIKFKLKVKEAQDLGRDTLQRFVREYNSYRNQLAKPYLEDRRVDSLLVNEAYERAKLEVRASHIMVDLSPGALPKDTAAAYNKIMNIRAQIIKGHSTFEVQAKKFSTDFGTKDNGGDLGYFTVFDMVYPFETAAYNTPVGEISKPVRTQFGYHIIKVTDKRPSSGQVQVKHIFLISNDKTEEAKAKAAEQRINEIYQRLQAGENFDQLAKQFSDDKNTADKGGLLKPFGINDMMQEFEDQSFALKDSGDYSQPFKTQIGWHIVMLVNRQEMSSFDESKQYIEQQISRDSRSAKGKEVFIANLKAEYNFSENKKRIAEVINTVDESYLAGKWNPESAAKYKKTIFTLNGEDYNQQDFVAFMAEAQKRGNKLQVPTEQAFADYKRFVDKTIIAYENSRLEEKYPDFKLLVEEYHDGILLFDLTQEKVWNKASQDSVGLHNYWMAHQSEYMWPDRVHANLYSCQDLKTAKKVAKLLKKNRTTADIEAELNQESQLTVVPDSGKFAKGEKAILDQIEWKAGTVEILEENNRFIVVQIHEILPAQPKAFEESRGPIISDYQKQLEKAWLDELHQKYTITIDQEVFRQVEAELN